MCVIMSVCHTAKYARRCSAKYALNVRINNTKLYKKDFFVLICVDGALTYSLIVGVQQLHEGC